MLLGITSLMKEFMPMRLVIAFIPYRHPSREGKACQGRQMLMFWSGQGCQASVFYAWVFLAPQATVRANSRSANVYSKSTLGPMKEGRLCTLGRLSFRSTSAATERLRLAPAKSLPRLTAALASSLLFLRLPKGIVTLLLGLWNSHMIWI